MDKFNLSLSKYHALMHIYYLGKMEEKFDCILLVDDDLIANFIHSRLIKKLNITNSIVVTQNGKEALNYIRKNDAPDLILLDLNMPVMNGFEFLETFFQELADKDKTKVIVLSSSISSRDRHFVSSFGIPFLSKPLLSDELLKAIQKMLPILILFVLY